MQCWRVESGQLVVRRAKQVEIYFLQRKSVLRNDSILSDTDEGKRQEEEKIRVEERPQRLRGWNAEGYLEFIPVSSKFDGPIHQRQLKIHPSRFLQLREARDFGGIVVLIRWLSGRVRGSCPIGAGRFQEPQPRHRNLTLRLLARPLHSV